MNEFESMVEELTSLRDSITVESLQEDPEGNVQVFRMFMDMFLASCAVINATDKDHLPKVEMAKFALVALTNALTLEQ